MRSFARAAAGSVLCAASVHERVSAAAIANAVLARSPNVRRRSGVEGTAILRVVVRADGSVGRVEVVDSTHPAFSVAAMDAVTQWRYAPAIRMGEAVDAYREVRMEFRADGFDERE